MTFYEPWRVAKSLLRLVRQVNDAAPDRAMGNDGGIGDKAHQARDSDHNPQFRYEGFGIVSAYDITNDPAHGVDCNKISAAIAKSNDTRLKYIIWNRKIWNPAVSGTWRPANDHEHHMHVSVKRDPALFDNDRPWQLGDLKPDPNARPALNKPVLKRGSHGPDVTYVQVMLSMSPADSWFGAQTTAAVIEFQRAHGLVADGIVGGYTWRALLAAQQTA